MNADRLLDAAEVLEWIADQLSATKEGTALKFRLQVLQLDLGQLADVMRTDDDPAKFLQTMADRASARAV